MAKGISLNIGLNSVDPNHYGGWDGQLSGCENDANDMAKIARASNFDVKKLLTKDGTVENVKASIHSAAQELKSDDYFFLSYSGHGGQLSDLNRDERDDHYDETWCLYDREFVDDELNVCLRDFQEGVRIFVLSDSCHSGTVVRGEALKKTMDIDTFKSNVDKNGTKFRFAPRDVLIRTYQQNKALYDGILKDVKNREMDPIASIILISGCQDQQLSADGLGNGYFTENLLNVWGDGAFKGSYEHFHKLILDSMMDSNPPQHPNYFKNGKPNTSFDKSTPFTI
jgi:metacaspase-1